MIEFLLGMIVGGVLVIVVAINAAGRKLGNEEEKGEE